MTQTPGYNFLYRQYFATLKKPTQIRAKTVIVLSFINRRELIFYETFLCYSKPDYNMASEIPLNLFACEYDVPCGWQYNTENLEHVLKKLKSMWTLQSTK